MSMRYKGARISATAATTTGGEDGSASGAWTLEQQMQAQAAGLWPLPPQPKYVEDVFSTYLYTGTGATQTINNGIDLAGKGGLIWSKSRSNASGHNLIDSARGIGNYFDGTQNPDAQNPYGIYTDNITSLNSTGYTLGAGTLGDINTSTRTYASWTFRKQPKFFDVVTWTGSNDSGTSIGQGIVPHNLGSAPGCVIIKNVTQVSTNWIVYHRSLSGGYRMLLNTTDAQTNSGSASYFSKYVSSVGWTQTNPDATNIYVGYNYQTNGNTDTIVAYLFAHDAGGFGATGTDNVISCGSYVGNGTAQRLIDVGFEPQWVLYKNASDAAEWRIIDNMRGFVQYGTDSQILYPNASSGEGTFSGLGLQPSGWLIGGSANTSSNTYIYIAIRRGPMKVPESGTEVFSPVVISSPTSTQTVTTNFPVDMTWSNEKAATSYGTFAIDRLRSNSITSNRLLQTTNGNAEGVNSWGGISFQSNTSIIDSVWNYLGGGSSTPVIYWNFRRAPGFFDEVCYTGPGTVMTVSHNLQVVPELMIVKPRSATGEWTVYSAALGATAGLYLNLSNNKYFNSSNWNDTSPTSSVFTVGANSDTNFGNRTYVAYLFASCPGVSKVGSYTGTGTTQTINCGFAAGARFVLVKRTDSTGDWYVWDSARGMVSGTDPSLLLNSTAAEVNANSIYTATTGFQIVSTAAGINASGGSYIFLAIA